MAEVKIPPKRSLTDRLRDVARSQSVSLMPEDEPRKKGKEPVPDLRTLVPSASIRARILRLSRQIAEWGVAEKEAKKAKEPLVADLKECLEAAEVDAKTFTVDDLQVQCYGVTRSSISRDKLLEHGIAPKIITACTETKTSKTLKVSIKGEETEDES